jgi:hypothetical protein
MLSLVLPRYVQNCQPAIEQERRSVSAVTMIQPGRAGTVEVAAARNCEEAKRDQRRAQDETRQGEREGHETPP